MAKLVSVVIDRSSPIPLYHQLAEQLAAAITSGSLQPGDPFENEVALAERLGVSRPTVRHRHARGVRQPRLPRLGVLHRRHARRALTAQATPASASSGDRLEDVDAEEGAQRLG